MNFSGETEIELRRQLLLEDKLLGQQRRRGQLTANMQFSAAAIILVSNVFYTITPWTMSSIDFRLVAYVVAALASVPLTVMVLLNVVREVRHAVRMVDLRTALEPEGERQPSRYSRLRKILRQLRDAA